MLEELYVPSLFRNTLRKFLNGVEREYSSRHILSSDWKWYKEYFQEWVKNMKTYCQVPEALVHVVCIQFNFKKFQQLIENLSNSPGIFGGDIFRDFPEVTYLLSEFHILVLELDLQEHKSEKTTEKKRKIDDKLDVLLQKLLSPS
jgi:hypothetical protein